MKKNPMADKLAIIQKDSSGMLATVKAMVIKTPEQMTEAVNMLTSINARRKRIEELRVFFVKPLNDQVKSINLEFKGVSEPFFEMECGIKNRMGDYRKIEADKIAKEREAERIKKEKKWKIEQAKLEKKREREAEKERKRLAKLDLSKKDEKKELKRIKTEQNEQAEEDAKEEIDFDDNDFKQDKTVHSDGGSIKVRKKWSYKIENEKQVPKEYMKIDEVEIRKAIRKGVRVIKGVDIFEDETIAVTS